MTIHDILVNCGSVQSDTLITIITGTFSVKRQCFFKYLQPKYESLHFNYFTVGFMMREDKPKLTFQFYV